MRGAGPLEEIVHMEGIKGETFPARGRTAQRMSDALAMLEQRIAQKSEEDQAARLRPAKSHQRSSGSRRRFELGFA